jgi:hypothetical protein
MKRLTLIGSLVLAAVLAFGLMGYKPSSSKAMPLLGITDTPTAEPIITDTPEPPTDTPEPPTDTPQPRDTLTPTNTPKSPARTSVPATPTPAPPVGTVTLPTAGDSTVAPPWLLLSIAGGFLALGAYLLRRSNRSL